MRILLRAGIAGFLLVLLGFMTIALATDEENQPVMVLDEIMYDMGKIFEQDLYNHVFVVKNSGKSDLIINNVKPG